MGASGATIICGEKESAQGIGNPARNESKDKSSGRGREMSDGVRNRERSRYHRKKKAF